jgi:hypothetical protein
MGVLIWAFLIFGAFGILFLNIMISSAVGGVIS